MGARVAPSWSSPWPDRGWTSADAVAALVVAVLMAKGGWGLLRDSGRILLLGQQPLPVAVAAPASGDLGQEDRRLGRLPLAEQHPVLAPRVGPVLQQLAGRRGDARVAPLSPDLDLAAQVVDQRVALPALAGQVEVGRLLREPGLEAAALPGRRDRDEGLARASARPDLAGGAVVPDDEVLLWRSYGELRIGFVIGSATVPRLAVHELPPQPVVVCSPTA